MRVVQAFAAYTGTARWRCPLVMSCAIDFPGRDRQLNFCLHIMAITALDNAG